MSQENHTAFPLRSVVTGASSGIGREIAYELCSLAQQLHSATQSDTGSTKPENAHSRMVVHFCQNRAGAQETAEEVERRGVEVIVVQGDLRVAEDRKRIEDQAWEFLEQPTTWVNNAGADVLTGKIAKSGFDAKLRLLMETDVFGTIELSRSVVERMRRSTAPDDRPPPSMTFIGWDQAPLGMEGDAGQMFGPVKAAVMAFANSLAQEVAPQIRVNTVAPGWIQTAWGKQTDSYWDNRAKSQALMSRWGTPQDVARAVRFVSDPDNTFCTGQTILANGGWNRSFQKDS